jgi:hypothetical protein
MFFIFWVISIKSDIDPLSQISDNSFFASFSSFSFLRFLSYFVLCFANKKLNIAKTAYAIVPKTVINDVDPIAIYNYLLFKNLKLYILNKN